MSKLKEFLGQKIGNFKVFIDQQFEKLKINGVDIEESKKTNIKNDLNEFENNISHFVQHMSYLEGREMDDCVKIFLMKYEIDINLIKPHIDYEKLERYLAMFLDVIKSC
jgi:hypothetical protein